MFRYILFSLVIFSCSKNYQSSDLVSDKVFAEYAIEGPAFKDGKLYAVNFEKNGTIGVVENGQASLFVNLPEGSTGNSIQFNSKANMFIADYTGHNVLKVDMRTKEISVFAHDSGMNQPNDIVITQNDFIYASDPNWKESTGNLWRISPYCDVKLLESGMGTTNGIAVSPDEKYLYVNESVQLKVWRYEISEDMFLRNKTLFYQFEKFGLDGMKCDNKGNLYVCRYGKAVVAKISPEGKLIREIKLKGSNPSNIVLAGENGKQAFVTMHKRGAIETFFIE